MKDIKKIQEFFSRNEPVNEEINTDIVNRNINLLDKAADMAIKNPKGNVVELAKIIKKYISGIRNSMNESVNEVFSKSDWDEKWKMPKDSLFNATKTTDAVNSRYKALQNLLKGNPKELKAFDAVDDHPAYNMSYDELMKWYNGLKEGVIHESKWMDLWDESQEKAPSAWTKHQKWIVANAERYGFDPTKVKKLLKQHTAIHNRTYGMFASVEDWMEEKLKLKESVNEGLPPGYAKFLVSLQTLIGDIAPNAWGNKSQITSSSVKRVHNSLKKRYGDDYAKFNDLLKTQKGQFGNWYLNEPVNEAVPDDGDVYGWYWPIADKAMERLKKDSKYSETSLGAVGSGDGSTYISITVDFPSGSEEHFDVFFDGEEGNEQVTNIESTFVSEGKKPVNEADKYVDARGNFKLRNGLEVKIKSASEIQKLNISEDYMKYNLQIAGQTVKIEKAFRGVFGGAPSEFTVKGYEAFETRSTEKPRVGFTQSIIGSVTGSDVVRESRTSTISKRRAQAELKQKLKGTRSDGMGKYTATIYGMSGGKRVELKNLNDLNKYSEFEIDESVNEGGTIANQAYSFADYFGVPVSLFKGFKFDGTDDIDKLHGLLKGKSSSLKGTENIYNASLKESVND